MIGLSLHNNIVNKIRGGLKNTGWVFASSSGQDSSNGGTGVWVNTSNILTSNDVYCTILGQRTLTPYLQALFPIDLVPTTAVISGIEVSVERKKVGENNVVDLTAQMWKGGVIQDLVGTNQSTGASWSLTEGEVLFGGYNNLWGTTWTPSELNNSDFAFYVNVNVDALTTASVDAVKIKIYYY